MKVKILACVLVGIFVNTCSANRVLNLTNLENCKEFGDEPTVLLKGVTYHVIPETGISDTVHGEFIVKSGEHFERKLTLTLFKCSANPQATEHCQENPTYHEEILSCDRLIGDSSGPWAMFSEAIAGANCGKDEGVFSMDYSTLKLDNIIKYLDIYDSEFGRFRMRMHFWSVRGNSLRACTDLDFTLTSF